MIFIASNDIIPDKIGPSEILFYDFTFGLLSRTDCGLPAEADYR